MLFGAVYAADGSATGVLIDVAREFSPRIEMNGPRAVTIDLSGLTRLFGDARAMGEELVRTAADRGLRVRVAIAGTRTAARLFAARAFTAREAADRQGPPRNLIVIDPGTEAAALAPLPLTVLAYVAKDLNGNAPKNGNGPNGPNDPNDQVLNTFRRWGLRTLGDVAALPPDAVAARLGQEGVRWQRLARGEDPRPLLPAVPEERFEQALDLEWPIEGLEPLSFVLGRLMDPLSAQLERRGRGAAVLHVRLHLVTRTVHERSLHLPAPMRDARALRTLALLDLESHPPAAAIDRVVVAVDPTPARVLQFSLLTRPLPSPEQISTLMARLTALMGEGRCGSPALVDSWQPGAFAMKTFVPVDSHVIHRHGPRRHEGTETNLSGLHDLRVSVSPWPVGASDAANTASVALRRFRFPVPARVRVEQGRPLHVVTDRVAMRLDDPELAKRSAFADRRGSSGGVTQCAGPWRTSGNWWTDGPHKAGFPPCTPPPHRARVRDGDPGPARGGASHGVTEENQKDLRVSVVSVPPWPVALKAWDRDEWDVTLSDGATYRVFRDRGTDAWFLEGIVD